MKSLTTRRRVVSVSAAALLSTGLSPRRLRAAEINLKFGTTEPLGSPLNNRALQAFQRIRKETNGRVDIQLFPNNMLGGLTAMIGQVRAAVRHAGGHATLFRTGPDNGGRRQAGVFTPLSAPLMKIHRGLKAAFDPARIFNRGRLYPDF